jgi:type 1 glutamine amidotransferase/sugar phosphate isomerase/epimerase
MRTLSFTLVAGLSVMGSAQTPAPANIGAPGRGMGGQGRGGAPGAPPVVSESLRRVPEWGALRTGTGAILGWKLGISLSSFPELTFADAAAKADALGLINLEASSEQKVSVAVQKKLGEKLMPGEMTAVQNRLLSLGMRMPAYAVPALGTTEKDMRDLFHFAKAFGVETMVVERTPDGLPLADKLADEYGVKVALRGSLKSVEAAIEGRGSHIGAYGDTGSWMQEGIKPTDALAQLKERLFVVNLSDRSALGASGRSVALGTGAAAIPEFLHAMYTMQVKPSLITVGLGGAADTTASLEVAVKTYETLVRPVFALRVEEMGRNTPIVSPNRLTAEERQKVEAAVPAQAAAKPKKPRQLLVIDLGVGHGPHNTVPAVNLAIGIFGKRTGAYEAVFSNDIDNFKYDKIKHFDAVFLNNTVGMLFADQEVRDGLSRFVREGGGLAGYHGTSHVSMDWPEMVDMIGAGVEHNRTGSPSEAVMVKIDDPNSPLTVPFAGKEFLHSDELYRFIGKPYSREKLHVLLSIDTEKTDMYQPPGCSGTKVCYRADDDYALSWIHNYGKGRVFYCALGDQKTLFMDPAMVDHFMRAIQFVLGDLEADTTPSASLGAGSVALLPKR